MSLCLNMIVKNESHIVADTLANICQHFPITHWVISDTGSSDNTIVIIEDFFADKGISGHIHQEPWQNFSHNRNAALQQCEGKADYVLFFDADDFVTGHLVLPELTKDTYLFKLTSESGKTKYYRKLIVKNDGQYRWRGVLHEYLHSDKEKTRDYVEGDYAIVSGRKGSRSLNKNKYREDAELLKAAYLKGEDTDLLPRYAFYCAQSYRDAKMVDEAIEWYKIRAKNTKGWRDERYCSYKELGSLFEKKKDYTQALYYWQQGTQLDPLRAECWYHLARRHSWNKEPQLAYDYAKRAVGLDIPKGNRLFVSTDIYHYWSYYEWCLNAYRLGNMAESYEAFKKLTVHGTEDLIDRLTPQVKHYRPYILKDNREAIKDLSTNLKRLNRVNVLNDVLFIQQARPMNSIEQNHLRIQAAADKPLV